MKALTNGAQGDALFYIFMLYIFNLRKVSTQCASCYTRYGLTVTWGRVGIDIINYITKYATEMKAKSFCDQIKFNEHVLKL